jgi:hypothetical protein
MEDSNVFDFLSLLFDKSFDSLDEFLDVIFGWIFYVFDFALDLFFGFLLRISPNISNIGHNTVNSFDSAFHFDFTSDFIFFFVGLLVVVFVFKLLWSVIP